MCRGGEEANLSPSIYCEVKNEPPYPPLLLSAFMHLTGTRLGSVARRAGLDTVAKTTITPSAKNLAPAANPAVNFNK